MYFFLCVLYLIIKKKEKRNSPTPSSSSQNIHSVSLSWWRSGSHPHPFSLSRVLLLLSEHRSFIFHWSPCHLSKSPTVLHDFYTAPRPTPATSAHSWRHGPLTPSFLSDPPHSIIMNDFNIYIAKPTDKLALNCCHHPHPQFQHSLLWSNNPFHGSWHPFLNTSSGFESTNTIQMHQIRKNVNTINFLFKRKRQKEN